MVEIEAAAHCCQCQRVHREAAPAIPNGHRRRRRALERGREAADQPGPRVPEGRADLVDGRADERARRRERGAGRGQPVRADARAHDVDGRPPAHHHPARRHDPGRGERAPDRDGHPRRSPRRAGLLRPGRQRSARSARRRPAVSPARAPARAARFALLCWRLTLSRGLLELPSWPGAARRPRSPPPRSAPPSRARPTAAALLSLPWPPAPGSH